ncbi:hypothetical protein BH10BAC4_BH10BAC4_11870 [soil metagenome]
MLAVKIQLLFILCCLSMYPAFSQERFEGWYYSPQTNSNLVYRDLLGNRASLNELRTRVSSIDKAIPSSVKFSYDQFLDGAVYYVSGNRLKGLKLNYNLLNKEMQFISGDQTLVIEDDPSLRYVRIGKDFYYHDLKKGYFKIIGVTQIANLIVSQSLRILKYANAEKNGEGKYPFTPETVSSNHVSVDSIFFQNEIVACSVKKNYFLHDLRDQIHPANKQGFLKAFPGKSWEIEGHLRQMALRHTPINFYSEEDLLQLIKFCNSLLYERLD